MSYKHLPKDHITNKERGVILRLSDNAQIPFDEANSDYQEYLLWAKTNTPEEAD